MLTFYNGFLHGADRTSPRHSARLLPLRFRNPARSFCGARNSFEYCSTKSETSHLPQTSLDRALDFVRQAGVAALPVLDNTGRLVGLFTPENVSELLMVKSALGKKKRGMV